MWPNTEPMEKEAVTDGDEGEKRWATPTGKSSYDTMGPSSDYLLSRFLRLVFAFDDGESSGRMEVASTGEQQHHPPI